MCLAILDNGAYFFYPSRYPNNKLNKIMQIDLTAHEVYLRHQYKSYLSRNFSSQFRTKKLRNREFSPGDNSIDSAMKQQESVQAAEISLMDWHHIARNNIYLNKSVRLSVCHGAPSQKMEAWHTPRCQDTSYLFRFADRLLHTK